MYSDNLRSSAWARRESCSSRFSGRRSFSSSVHFSAMMCAQKNPPQPIKAAAGCEVPAADAGRREKRAIEAGISGRLFRTVDRRRKLIGYKFADLVHPQRRNGIAPLVNRLHGNAERSRQRSHASELSDRFFDFHAAIKPCFTTSYKHGLSVFK